jgi:hypothetical protein
VPSGLEIEDVTVGSGEIVERGPLSQFCGAAPLTMAMNKCGLRPRSTRTRVVASSFEMRSMSRDARQKRDLHALNEDGMVLCNPRDREAAHRAAMEGIATDARKAVTCRKCLSLLYKKGQPANGPE